MRAHVYYFPKYGTPGYLAEIQKRVINFVLNMKLLYQFYWQRGGVRGEGGMHDERVRGKGGVAKGGCVWQKGGMHGKGGVCGEGACVVGRYAWQRVCMAGGMCGRGCVAGGIHVRRDSHRSGRYTSYWNAFLFGWVMTSSEGIPDEIIRRMPLCAHAWVGFSRLNTSQRQWPNHNGMYLKETFNDLCVMEICISATVRIISTN